MRKAGVAFVGCGDVADYYARTIGAHSGLELIGVCDRVAGRAERFSAHQ